MSQQGTNNCAPLGKEWWSLNRAFKILTYLFAESLQASPPNCIIHQESHLGSTTGTETLGKETTGKEETLLLSFELLISFHQKTLVYLEVFAKDQALCAESNTITEGTTSPQELAPGHAGPADRSSLKRVRQEWWTRWLPLSSTAYHPSSASASRATGANTHFWFHLLLDSLSPLNCFIPRKQPWQAHW